MSLIINLWVEAWQRSLHGPKLELHCEARDHRAPIDWLDESNKKIGEVIYVRMRVRNVKPRIAKSCRAYLTKVERLKPDGKTWENTNFSEAIQLAWAGQGTGHGFDAISLPKGVDQFIDVVAVGKLLPFAPPSESANKLPTFPKPQWAVTLVRYSKLLERRDTYQLTVLVAGDGVMPISRRIIVKWSGVWDEIDVSDGK
jgi:hypothetical protein